MSTDTKLAFIRGLVDAGLRDIEVTSFVHPKWVPQLADADAVCRGLPAAPHVTFATLVPNLRGLERAVAAGVRRIAIFTAASETFCRKNINMTIAESLAAFREVVTTARQYGMSVRGYVSTCFVCPYEGEVPKENVRPVVEDLLDMGGDEVAVSDTIGAAVPTDIDRTVGYLLETAPAARLALHLHDTYGTALANMVAGLRLGITTFDASAGGLGGCPYAPGASGNLATEDLVYMLQRMGIETGVDLTRLAAASRMIESALGRPLPSRQLRRLSSCMTRGAPPL